MSHVQSSPKTKGRHHSKAIRISSEVLWGYPLLYSNSQPPPSKTPVPQTCLSGTLTRPWLPLYFLSATTEGFRPTGLNSAGAERGRGEALAQAQLSASSQCGLTGVRFTRAWTGAQLQICAQRNVVHATTNTWMCACARMFLSICCPRNPCFSSAVTNTVGWFMSVDEELFLRTDYLCAYACGCVFFHKYKV